MAIYNYYMTQRPPMPGAMPKHDLVGIQEYKAPMKIPCISDHVYAQIQYSRKLSPEEIRDYELKEPAPSTRQRKVCDICENGMHIMIIKYPDQKQFPYRVYKMRDKWHRKQIAKEETLLMALAAITDLIKFGEV